MAEISGTAALRPDVTAFQPPEPRLPGRPVLVRYAQAGWEWRLHAPVAVLARRVPDAQPAAVEPADATVAGAMAQPPVEQARVEPSAPEVTLLLRLPPWRFPRTHDVRRVQTRSRECRRLRGRADGRWSIPNPFRRSRLGGSAVQLQRLRQWSWNAFFSPAHPVQAADRE